MIDSDDEVNVAAVVVLPTRAKRPEKIKTNKGKSGINHLVVFKDMHVFKKYTDSIQRQKQHSNLGQSESLLIMSILLLQLIYVTWIGVPQ